MTLIVQMGGRTTPLSTAPSDPLAGLDPVLSTLCSTLQTSIPPMLGAVQATLPQSLSAVIAMALPYRPSITQMTTVLQTPLLAMWRERCVVADATLSSLNLETELVIAYIMPALTDSEWSKWTGLREFVASCIVSFLHVNATSLSSTLLSSVNRIAPNTIEYGVFGNDSGLELQSALIKCTLHETWTFIGHTNEASTVVGLDYSVSSETYPSLAEGSQTFGD